MTCGPSVRCSVWCACVHGLPSSTYASPALFRGSASCVSRRFYPDGGRSLARITPVSIKVYEAYRIAKGHDPYTVLWSIRATALELFEERLAVLYRAILDGHAERAALRGAEVNRLFQAWLSSQDYNPETLPAHQTLSLSVTWSKEFCPLELRTGGTPNIAVTHRQILTEVGHRDAEVEGARAGVFTIDQWFHKRYREQIFSAHRNEWNFDASISVRVYRGRYYLVPYIDRVSLLGNFLSSLATDNRLEEFAYWNNTDKPEEVSESAWRWRRKVWEDLLKEEQNFLSLDIVSHNNWHAVATSSLCDMLREFGFNSEGTNV